MFTNVAGTIEEPVVNYSTVAIVVQQLSLVITVAVVVAVIASHAMLVSIA